MAEAPGRAPPSPLLRRFPALAALPRAALCHAPPSAAGTPVERADVLAPSLWVKRDDLSAAPLGGNKPRALEFLLGGVGPGDHVLTVGALGSTHALATALYAKRLGARVTVLCWPQEMNAGADATAARLAATADRRLTHHTVAGAYLRALWERSRGARWVPAGGSSPLGILGHVNAALELAEQVEAGVLPAPDRVVVPLGSGGTAAGLALGFRIAGLRTRLVAARVVPRVVANRRRVLRLADATARLIERLAGDPRRRLPRPSADDVQVRHEVYGGAYGRELARAREAASAWAARGGPRLDATYSAKALAAALTATRAGGETLFWLTFDGRWLDELAASV